MLNYEQGMGKMPAIRENLGEVEGEGKQPENKGEGEKEVSREC